MDLKGRNLGTWDSMHNVHEGYSDLARDKKNDCESELTANHFNRIYHAIVKKIKKIFKIK